MSTQSAESSKSQVCWIKSAWEARACKCSTCLLPKGRSSPSTAPSFRPRSPNWGQAHLAKSRPKKTSSQRLVSSGTLAKVPKEHPANVFTTLARVSSYPSRNEIPEPMSSRQLIGLGILATAIPTFARVRSSILTFCCARHTIRAMSGFCCPAKIRHYREKGSLMECI